MRLRHPGTIISVIGAAALIAACGGGETETDGGETENQSAAGGTRTFENEDFEITFEYPAKLDVQDDVSFGATTGSGAEASAGARLGREDFFAVQLFPLEVAVTGENLDQFIPEADAVFSELAGEEVTGEQADVAGLPALRYEFGPSEAGDGSTRAIVVFDEKTEYLLTCKSTPARSELIDSACDLAIDTMEVR